MFNKIFLATLLLSTVAKAQDFDQANYTSLEITSIDAHTACDWNTASLQGTLTASLTCANTGDLISTKWSQATVNVLYTKGGSGAGSAVNMQCDSSKTGAVPWRAIQTIDASGASTVRTWTRAITATDAWPWNFNINYNRLRCRFWITGGVAANDLISAYVTFSNK